MRIKRTICVVGLCVAMVGCQPAATTTESPLGAASAPGKFAAGTSGAEQWAIVLDAFEGLNHQMLAAQQVGAFAAATGLKDFWSVDEGERSMVYFGHYTSASEARAQSDAKTLRELVDSGRLRARMVSISPVVTAREQLDPMDLRSIENPDAVYTLEVGVYDGDYGAEYRKAAEAAAAEYRTAGEEAYFYHGPHQSLVTIGIFGHSAATVAQEGPMRGQPVYHAYIQELQRSRHPYLKVNGQTVLGNDPVSGEEVRMPSFLVRIPE